MSKSFPQIKDFFRRKFVLNSFHFIRIFIVWLCVLFYVNYLQSNLDRFVNHFTNLQVVYSETDRYLKDFIISGYRDSLLYRTGQQRDLANFDSGQKSITAGLVEIEHDARNSHINISREIDVLLNLHGKLADSVNAIKRLYQLRGYKDFGGEGSLRRYAHYLEDSSPMQKQDILMMRRREKDYIIRNELSYVSAFNKIADEQLIRFARDKTTASALEHYKDAFNKYAIYSKQIGFSDDAGLYKSIENLVVVMDAQYRATHDKVTVAVEHINLVVNIVLTITFAFLLAAAIGLNFDIRRRQRELERTSKELSDRYNDLMQFNYIVSHNLKSPLAGITGITEMLRMPDTSAEEKEMYVEHITGAVDKMNTTIKDLNSILESTSTRLSKR